MTPARGRRGALLGRAGRSPKRPSSAIHRAWVGQIYFGVDTYEAECASVGSEDYAARVHDEVLAFQRQVLRHYPPRGTARVHVKWFDHDFGRYAEVVVSFDEDDEEGAAYALEVERDRAGLLAKWDSEAILELAKWLIAPPQKRCGSSKRGR